MLSDRSASCFSYAIICRHEAVNIVRSSDRRVICFQTLQHLAAYGSSHSLVSHVPRQMCISHDYQNVEYTCKLFNAVAQPLYGVQDGA